MTDVLLDTNAYVAFKNGVQAAVEVVGSAPRVLLNSVVLGELLGGFSAGNREAQNRSELSAFLALPQVSIFTIDADTANHYAAVFAQLRKSGTPIPHNDMWIAATALQHGLSLFSYDQHFARVQRLRSGQSVTELLTP